MASAKTSLDLIFKKTAAHAKVQLDDNIHTFSYRTRESIDLTASWAETETSSSGGLVVMVRLKEVEDGSEIKKKCGAAKRCGWCTTCLLSERRCGAIAAD